MNRRVARPNAAAAGAAALLACAALLGHGCFSPDDPLDAEVIAGVGEVECATLNVTYENFAAAFFEKYCLRCHSASLSGDLARSDAPAGIDFDDLESIRSFTSRIALRAGELGDMPPALLGGERPSIDERVRLLQWIQCGTPSGGEAASP